MKSLISKSQSLFLVAILASFPSANAMSENDAEIIRAKMQDMYNNVNNKRKKLEEKFEAFKDQVEEKLRGNLVNENNPIIADLIRNISAINALEISNTFNQINNAFGVINDQIAALQAEVRQGQRQGNIALNMSQGPVEAYAPQVQNNPVRAMQQSEVMVEQNPQLGMEQERMNPQEINQGGMMEEPLQQQAEVNGTRSDPLLIELINTYAQQYREAQRDKRRQLTIQLTSGINGLRRGTDLDLNAIQDLVKNGNFSSTALRAIQALKKAVN